MPWSFPSTRFRPRRDRISFARSKHTGGIRRFHAYLGQYANMITRAAAAYRRTARTCPEAADVRLRTLRLAEPVPMPPPYSACSRRGKGQCGSGWAWTAPPADGGHDAPEKTAPPHPEESRPPAAGQHLPANSMTSIAATHAYPVIGQTSVPNNSPALSWIRVTHKTTSGSGQFIVFSSRPSPCPHFLQYIVRYIVAEIDDPATVKEKSGVDGVFVPPMSRRSS